MFGTFSIDKIENPEFGKATMRAAIRHWGNDLQMVKAIEEMGEMQRALARELIWLKLGEGDHREILHNLEEEWADAMIMLLQVGLMFDFGGGMVSAKLDRLAHKLAGQGTDVIDTEFIDEFMDHMRTRGAEMTIKLGDKTWTTELEGE